MPTDTKRLKLQIGNKVRALRKKKGLSQAKACDDRSISIDTWSRVERGRPKNPTLATFVEMANALGVQVGDLFPRSSGAAQEEPLAAILDLLTAHLSCYDEETQESVRKALWLITEHR